MFEVLHEITDLKILQNIHVAKKRTLSTENVN